jgi:quinol monooxygenase YgiN
MIALLVRFDLARGEEAAFDALLATTCAGIRTHEPGTLVYAVTRDPGRPSTRTLFEVYRDEAAFRAHEAQPHVRAFLDARSAHLAGPIVVERLQVTELASGPPGA